MNSVAQSRTRLAEPSEDAPATPKRPRKDELASAPTSDSAAADAGDGRELPEQEEAEDDAALLQVQAQLSQALSQVQQLRAHLRGSPLAGAAEQMPPPVPGPTRASAAQVVASEQAAAQGGTEPQSCPDPPQTVDTWQIDSPAAAAPPAHPIATALDPASPRPD